MAKEKMKAILDQIKEELSKLKDLDNEMVKEVLANVDTYLTQVEREEITEEGLLKPESSEEKVEKTKPDEELVPNPSDVKLDDPKTETKKEEENIEEIKSEEEPTKAEVPVVEEKPKEEVKSEEPSKEMSADIDRKLAIELSKETATKLNEAAFELDKLSKEVLAKDEIIGIYKTQISELKSKVDVFEEATRVELNKRFTIKATNLIELYANLGITKTFSEIKSSFSETQIDKLIDDLSVVELKKKQTRQTVVNRSVELNNDQPKVKSSAEEIVQNLFGL